MATQIKESQPSIGAIAPWYGSKRNLAPAIVAALGPHRAYWEPFCGSMAVLLAKPAATMETVNDLHGELINLARVIQSDHHGPELYRRLRRTLMHEDIFRDSVEFFQRDPHFFGDAPSLDRAYQFFIQSWMGRSGLAGTRGYNNRPPSVRYTSKGGHAAMRWVAAVDSIPAWRARLRKVVILRRDGMEILARIEDAPGTAIYVDPPYLAKSSLYEHDFTAADHRRLADTVARFRRARVVISYYDDPRLAELYPAADGWHYRRIDVLRALSNTGGDAKSGSPKSLATEVLLCNHAQTFRLGGMLF